MRKGDLLRRRVEDVELTPSKDLSAMVAAMGRGGGFTAKKIAVGAEIVRTMFRRAACWRFLSFPAALMATGARGILRGLVERKLLVAVITTCGTADHDLAGVCAPYYNGEYEMYAVRPHRIAVNWRSNV